MSVQSWRRALALILAVAALTVLTPTPAPAQPATQPAPPSSPTQPGPPLDTRALEERILQRIISAQKEDTTVRSPDSAANPVPEVLLPWLRDRLKTLPPFFRDTDLNFKLRTFYFNQQNDDGTAKEALAIGGWLQYVSGWAFDTFAVGSTYYTSQPLYAPETRSGTSLLTPGRDPIGVFGEAWGALRYKEYAVLKGYRLRIDEGYVNSQDNRMVPNTFEAVTVSGKVDWVQYDVGYLTNIKPRDSNDFISMSRQAGASGDNEGLVLTALNLAPIKGLTIYTGNYYAIDVFNTAFGKVEYAHEFSKDLKLQVGLQYTDQRSVGDERVGDFITWNVGAGARVVWRGLSVGFATHFTGSDANISSPWGSWPGYLSLQVTDFDRANEKAFGTGVQYDFGGTLLPFQIPGLSVKAIYGQGNDRINPATGAGQPTTREGDLDIIYNVPGIKGLSLRFRNAYVDRGNPQVLKEFRLIVNYDLNLL
jgi:hypothetical protein